MASNIQFDTRKSKPPARFEALLAAVVGATIALGFSLMLGLSPTISFALTVVAGLAVGQLTFSLLYFLARGRETSEGEVDASMGARGRPEMSVDPVRFEPARHREVHFFHYDYESGQPTETRSPSTPWFEHLDPEAYPVEVRERENGKRTGRQRT